MIGEKPNWNFMPAQTAGYGNADMSSADNQRTGHRMRLRIAGRSRYRPRLG